MADKRMTYREPRLLTHEEVLAQLASRDPDIVSGTLVSLGLFEENYEFAAPLILREAQDNDPIVRGAALIAMAHLARVHGRVPDGAAEIVRKALADSDEYIRGQGETAADDIEQFVPEVIVRLGRK
jgi:HEAT repeat protein